MREEYLSTRNNNQIHLNLIYKFYMDTKHETRKLPFEIFQQIFPMWLQHFQPTLEHYYQHFDMEFNIVKITMKDGKFKFI